MRKVGGRLFWVLLAGVILLVMVAAAAGVAYLLLRTPAATAGAWQDPILGLPVDEVASDLALYPLAGASELEAIDASIDTGELPTALAILSFSTSMTDRQRIGRLIVLGERATALGRSDLAALVFQMVYDLAVLSPRVNDPLRADALRAAGSGWARLEQKNAALAAFEQTSKVAEYSPHLQAAQRREVLAVLEAEYRSMGEQERAREVRNRLRQLEEAPSAQRPLAYAETPELPFGQIAVSSPEVGALEDSRRKAAFAVIESLGQGQEPSVKAVEDLAQALKAEDAAKMALYQSELDSTSQSSVRIEVHWAMIRWLQVKHQVASRAVGLSVVPEWEAQLSEIRSGLSTAYEDLLYDYEDLVTALPDASSMAPGRYQARRLVTLAGRLGQYPNYPGEQLAEKVASAAEELIAAGYSDDLYVDPISPEEQLGFVFRAGSEFGGATPSR